ncbi:STAS domain-containing protein [Leptospira sp. 201903070]|uniref:Anti-sigma factor antagonist n=2 Tax=Leptospira TaxID=171 RepID=A0A396ZBX3_9LEPT|nr:MULTISPECIES: STAS domain-containing protein [Leptospira]MBM9502800.1 STAS domain-containing protein [Leptospira ainazelensis]MBM9579180.1 STAS domain-containing protein [Leptospira ainlahdjerensis]RHX92761.1 anti-sigma factor antagonist [Leptospira stimsonii]
MEINHRKSGETNIVSLSGSLDIYTSIDLKTFFETNVNKENKNVVVNLEKLNYIDSSGIGMLIKQLNYVQDLNGSFFIANMKPAIEKVFKVAGLTSYFKTISPAEFTSNFP